jgi:hypothetical protein
LRARLALTESAIAQDNRPRPRAVSLPRAVFKQALGLFRERMIGKIAVIKRLSGIRVQAWKYALMAMDKL